MPTLDQTYYDDWYDADLSLRDSAHHRPLYDLVLSKVPADAEYILDVGCGDGALTDRLPRRRLVVGLDFSISALRQVQGPVVCARLDALCFPDESFDLVIATEVLEHLPHDQLQRSLAEISRVSRGRCLISVPNRQRLQQNRVTCPSCRSALHAHGHLQRFDPARLANLIPGFELQEVVEVGPEGLDFPEWLVGLRRLFAGEPLMSGGRTCPICGYVAGDRRRSPEPRGIPRSKRMLSFLARKRRPWLVADYVKARSSSPA